MFIIFYICTFVVNLKIKEIMKKIMLFIAVVAISIVSCTPKQAPDTKATTDTTTVDSVKLDSTLVDSVKPVCKM